jgi:DNA repair exonuclease SbcCD nuclease subunit
MSTKLLVIGDVHVKLDNLLEIKTLLEKISITVEQQQPDIIVLLGDILHTHERVHTNCLNAAMDLFRICSSLRPTYVLVGNHDFISNSQFLTTHHWMNSFKNWDHLTIVDTIHSLTHNGNRFVFSPYVPDGRLVEALGTLDFPFTEAHMIFVHQTLDGVKMGMNIANGVEEWKPEYPFCCSGHIHDKQRVQPNLYYNGTPMPHAFGERNDKTVSLFTVTDGLIELHQELKLDVCSKRLEYVTIQEAYTFIIEPKPHQVVRLTIKGSPEEIRAFKRSEPYKRFQQQHIKMVFDEISDQGVKSFSSRLSFEETLYEAVKSDKQLAHWYRTYIGHTEHDPEPIFVEE